jgi:hypothetical protein
MVVLQETLKLYCDGKWEEVENDTPNTGFKWIGSRVVEVRGVRMVKGTLDQLNNLFTAHLKTPSENAKLWFKILLR